MAGESKAQIIDGIKMFMKQELRRWSLER